MTVSRAYSHYTPQPSNTLPRGALAQRLRATTTNPGKTNQIQAKRSPPAANSASSPGGGYRVHPRGGHVEVGEDEFRGMLADQGLVISLGDASRLFKLAGKGHGGVLGLSELKEVIIASLPETCSFLV